MRDLNRKLEKFLKEKAAKKSTTTSGNTTPHLTYGVVSPGTANSKKSNRNFTMTVSFINPKFDKGYPKDFVVIHENTRSKIQEASDKSAPYSARSPKRNPILQDGDEPVMEFKSTIKTVPTRMTMFTEEQTYSRKIQGEYNDQFQSARSMSPKIEGIRTNNSPIRNNSPEIYKRQLKDVKTPHLIKPNPITHGDEEGVKLQKERKTATQNISEETKRMNDKKFNLPSDRTINSARGDASSRGRVFWDSNIAFGEDALKQDLDQKISARGISTPHQHKTGRDMKGLLGYEHAPTFKDQGVSVKVNSIPISQAIKAGDN